MDIRIGDEIDMKKPHPCGCSRFAVMRVGMDFRIRCTSCSREVMLPRKKVEKSIRAVYRDGDRLPLVKETPLSGEMGEAQRGGPSPAEEAGSKAD